MIKDNIHTSIITLTKNDNKKFLRTLNSVLSQKIDFKIEWLVIDGSNYKNQDKNLKSIKKLFNKHQKTKIIFKYINSKKEEIKGIYPCMNFGKKIARGKYIIFLNSGDIFFNSDSLKILILNSLDADPKNTFIFGQANIIASSKINWFFPGKKLKNIENWLRFFEPNHQSMMISKKLANSFDFSNKHNSISDGYWKRQIIKNSFDIIYVKAPIVKFYLDGVSSEKPSRRRIMNIIKNEYISPIRKFIFIIKFILPNNVFFIYHLLQKYKSLIIDLIL